MNVFDLFKKQAIKNPDKIAVIFGEEKYTYSELLKMILKTIIIFKKKGLKKHNIVLILEDNSIFHVLTLFAASFLNITLVPIGTSYSPNHVKKFIKIIKANSLIGDSYYLRAFNKLKKIKVKINTDDLKSIEFNKNNLNLESSIQKKNYLNKNYIISMTSGSTSDPKPLIYSQRTKIVRYKLFKKLYKIDSSDSIIITCPIATSLGMRMLFLPLLSGAKCVIMRKFTPKLYYNYVKKYDVTFSALVPSQIDDLINDKDKFKNFFLKKGLVSASSKLFDSTKKKIIKKKIKLFEMYGMAEMGTITSLKLSKKNNKPKYVGKVYDKKIIVKILSEHDKYLPKNTVGEIICKTPGRFEGYYGLSQLTKKAFFNGYFKTGDLGYLDNNNNLFYLGRKKNIIKRSGINIYPEDIENILLKYNKIKEVALVPYIKNSTTKLVLFIKKENKLSYEIVRDICLKKLSTFQLPDKIIIIKKFPKTASQKIDKLKIKKKYRIN